MHYTNIGLKVKSRILKSQIMKPMIELLKPDRTFKTYVCEVQTYVRSSNIGL